MLFPPPPAIALSSAGHSAVRLDPRQQHTITVALSSADCAAQRQENGILQQLLLLICAVPATSFLALKLGRLKGVAFTDVPAAADAAAAAAAEPATEPAAAAVASAAAAAAAPGFRVFVVARRVTAALIDRPDDVASLLLDSEAKPYIAGGWGCNQGFIVAGGRGKLPTPDGSEAKPCIAGAAAHMFQFLAAVVVETWADERYAVVAELALMFDS